MRISAKLVNPVLMLIAAGSGSFSAASPAQLGPNDLAFLFPAGQGLGSNASCDLLPSLEVMSGFPVLSRSRFQALIDSTAGYIRPIDPASIPTALIESGSLTKKQAQTMNQRIIEGLPTASCKNPLVPAIVRDLSDEEILSLNLNLALIRNLNQEICDYENWRVVGFRFDPCPNHPEVPGYDRSQVFPAQCTPQARLILQPYISNRGGTAEVLDYALHIFFEVQDPVAMLRKLRVLRDEAMTAAGLAGQGTGDVVLPAHPALKAAALQCDSQSSRQIFETFLKFMSTTTIDARLNKLTWMFSSEGSGQWTFGEMKIEDIDALKADPSQIVDDNFESFSLSAESQYSYPVRMDEQVRHIGMWYRDPLWQNPDASIGEQEIDHIHAVLHPDVTTQAGDAHDHKSNCISCHIVQQTQQRIIEELGELSGGLHAYAPGSIGIDRDLTRSRPMDNLRNFGYGPSFEPTMALRTINEIDRLVGQLRQKKF